jgi:hypothetical protein
LRSSHEFAKRTEIVQKAHVTLIPGISAFLDRTWLNLNGFLFQVSVELIIVVEILIKISKRIKCWWSWFDWSDDSSRILLMYGSLFLSIDIIGWNKIIFALFQWVMLSAEVENILLLFRNQSCLFFIGNCFSLKTVL